jgi:integrase
VTKFSSRRKRSGEEPVGSLRQRTSAATSTADGLTYAALLRSRPRACRQRWLKRCPDCGPRLHDLRHSFAVNTILDAYRDDDDPGARLAILSTYLGHINPVHTYWYLSASPELLKLAGDRLERHLGGDA